MLLWFLCAFLIVLGNINHVCLFLPGSFGLWVDQPLSHSGATLETDTIILAVVLRFFIQDTKCLPLLLFNWDLKECPLTLLCVSVHRWFMPLMCRMIQREFLAASTPSSWLFLAYRFVCECVCIGLTLHLFPHFVQLLMKCNMVILYILNSF